MRKLLFLFLCVLPAVSQAQKEKSELEQAIKQLQSAKAALNRAHYATINRQYQDRNYFDYQKARQDIDLVIQGIAFYNNGNRAQPRDPRQIKALTGHYDKMRKEK